MLRLSTRVASKPVLLARCLGTTTYNVPVIDLGRVCDPAATAEDFADVAAQVDKACTEVGFFSIVNHGIPDAVLADIWGSTRDFFNQDEASKEASAKMTTDYPYGYVGMGKEVLSKGKDAGRGDEDAPPSADLKESFSVGPSNPAAGMPPIQWPTTPASFQPSYEAYYSEMERVAGVVLGLFAGGLNLPRDWFADKVDRHRSVIRSLNYPDIEGEPLPGQLRASAHTDYGSLTILKQDDAPGGLQVLTRDGEWVDAVGPKDGFMVNIGDLMQRWTNDKWVSTMHRVRLPDRDRYGSCRRQSIAFFHNINADHVVQVLPTCVTPDNPARYGPITAFDHLMQKHLASIGELDPSELK